MSSDKETFEQFKARVDQILQRRVGVSSDDLADCNWRDLYEDCADLRGPDFEEAVLEEACEWNDGLRDAL